MSKPSGAPAGNNLYELWRLLNVARDSINPDQRGNPSPWSAPSSINELYDRLRAAEVSVPSSAQSSGFSSSRSTWTGEAGNTGNYSSAHFIRLLKEFEQGINASAQGSWDRSGWLSQCDTAAQGGGGNNVSELWRLLNVARDSINPDQRGNPSNWNTPSSLPDVYERLRAAEVSVPSSAQSAGFMSGRSTWSSSTSDSSNFASAHFIRLLKEFEQGINGSAQGSWDRSGWLAQCDVAAAGGGSGGGGGGGGGGNVNELWRLLNVARDSINPDQRGNPSNWNMPSSLGDVYERLRAAEVSVPSSAQSAGFMGSRGTWVTATNDSSSHSSAHFIRVLKEFEQGINGSAQGSWDRSGWLSQCDAAASGAGGGGGGAVDVGVLWRLLNEARDSILPEHRGSPSPWTFPSNINECFQRLRAAEVSVPSSAQSSSFSSSRSQWTTDCDNAANHNAAGFIRQLKAFEVGINGSAQGSWDRSGWISRCDAAAASGASSGGGGGGGEAATLWRLLNEARDSILPDQRGSPSPWSMPANVSECFARLRAAETSVPSAAQSSSFTSSRATWVMECDNAATQNTPFFIRQLKAFEVGINGSSQGSWDRSGWISRCDAAAASFPAAAAGGGGGDKGGAPAAGGADKGGAPAGGK